MRFSKLFGRTLREAPAEAETISHRLLLRAGMIEQLASGVYSYLPLGWRILRKIEQIIREEMEAAGGQEFMLPVLQPFELWEESGRHRSFGKSLFTLLDRRNRKLCLGPTHEEVVTLLASHLVRSYRDLPKLIFQIQTKFRDEPRPRGGLLRVREFAMKDLYSLDADEEGLERSYRLMMRAYENVYRRCGLRIIPVEADSGAIGGKDSHEFMALCERGEDEVIYCPSCGYSANQERAVFSKPALEKEEPLPLEEVATPGVKTIEELSQYLRIPREKTLKAVFYSADGEVVFVVIRGDLEVNEVKLKNALKCFELGLATSEEVERAGLVAGSASPVGLSGIKIVADDSILLGNNFVVGGNKPDTHLRNANYPRDFEVDLLVDIALAQGGYRCSRCGGELCSARGIEVGHLFKLGTIFSERFGAFYLDREGQQRPIVMGCYGIGLGRLLAAVVEQNHDEKGICWPPSIAPYQIYLCPLSLKDAEVAREAENLYQRLLSEGFEVLYDDREESAGVKFNDADLLGLPLRLVLSPRTVRQE
ncbi:MAG: proline--tRNA ligase, partial [Chloroflexi bacterium]